MKKLTGMKRIFLIVLSRLPLSRWECWTGIETKELVQEYRETYKPNIRFSRFSKNGYNSRQKRFDSDQKKCLKGLKNEAISPIYIVKKNNGYTFKPKHFTWIQSTINIHSIFKFPKHTLDNSSVIYLRPNGEYFVSRLALPIKFIKSLINFDSWEKPKEDLANSIRHNSPSGIGVFRDINRFYDANHKSDTITFSGRGLSVKTINTYKNSNVRNYPENLTTCFK